MTQDSLQKLALAFGSPWPSIKPEPEPHALAFACAAMRRASERVEYLREQHKLKQQEMPP